jgi:integrase/recombinase XerC
MAGGPPRRRQRADRIWLAIEVIEQFRPLYGRCEHPVMWRGERGGQGSSPYISERFAHYRDDLGLPPELTSHGLRHSYIRHLIEGGF